MSEKSERVHALVNAGAWPGMSEAFDAHMGAACWTDPAYAPDAATWAAAWKVAKRGADSRKPCTCDGAGRGPGRECVLKAGGRLGELWRCAETLPADVAAARQTAEYWKAEHLAGNARIGELHDEIANLRAALQWYADGLHFDKASPDAWDTVSGEPQNWWCDEAGTAMVEDGSLAGMVLEGKLTGDQLGALKDGEAA